ncbi:MAG: tetratricopeptide repeat protein [Nitrospirae bacterium]|nr:tetratricopeptide repeat protein [Nitrospirota bacterium]
MPSLMRVLLPVFMFASCVLEPAYPSVSSPQSLEDELRHRIAANADKSSDPAVLVKLASLYLNLGDDGYTDVEKRRTAYEAGARVAKRALELQNANAEAHYLYAANLGSAAQLKGMMASALTIQELKYHVKRALELQKDHAPSLHMMGMMLEELPWVMGGDSRAALGYLQRAVAVDPTYSHARLDLAKAYLKRKDVASARRELHSILEAVLPPAGQNQHEKEARALLDSLELQQGSVQRP